jgi:hypothetical protein
VLSVDVRVLEERLNVIEEIVGFHRFAFFINVQSV